VRNRYRAQRDAEPATRHAPTRKQGWSNALHGRRGDDEDLSTRAERRHAEPASAEIERGAPLLAAGKPHVELNAGLDPAAAHAVPFRADGIHHAEPGARV